AGRHRLSGYSAAPASRAASRRAWRLPVIWTGDVSATVDPTRLAGPADGWITPDDTPPVDLPGPPPWRLSLPAVRAALYRHCLVDAGPFEIYRWVNLAALAHIWPSLDLPDGVASDWH